MFLVPVLAIVGRHRRQFLPPSRIGSPVLERPVSKWCGGDALHLQLVLGRSLVLVFDILVNGLKKVHDSSTPSMILDHAGALILQFFVDFSYLFRRSQKIIFRGPERPSRGNSPILDPFSMLGISKHDPLDQRFHPKGRRKDGSSNYLPRSGRNL